MEQSDQDLHCLQFHLHLLEALFMKKLCCSNFRVITANFSDVRIFRIFTECWVVPCYPCPYVFQFRCLWSPWDLVYYMNLVHLFIMYAELSVFFRFLLVSWVGWSLWLWHSLDISLLILYGGLRACRACRMGSCNVSIFYKGIIWATSG